jgi:hypothetical protein
MRARADYPRTSVVRLAELGLATLILLGSCALAAIPLATLYLLSRLSGDYSTIYLMALIGCPLALVLWGIVLIRLDRLLSHVRGIPAGEPRAGSALDAGITVAVLIALAAMVLWYVLGDVPGPGPRVFL